MGPPYRFAVLGRPVSHSRSPAIHAEALRLTGLTGTYEAIDAGVEDLSHHLEQLRSGEMSGFNVTMPLKEEAARRCDRLTEIAARAGSVNALRVRSGVLEGHTLDSVAFGRFLAEEIPAGSGEVLVLGSGGSARAALAALAETGGRRCFLSARDRDKADRLASEFGASSVPWGSARPSAIVVNATPIGMYGEVLSPSILDDASALIDLPYAAGETPAIARMRRRNAPCRDGIEFLACQASASFEWWTGHRVEWARLMGAARKT